MAEDKTIKIEIIVKEYIRENHNLFVSIAWKKIGNGETRRDYIVIPKDSVRELTGKLLELEAKWQR